MMTRHFDPKIPLSTFTTWLARGERGISSEAIVEAVTGECVGHYSPLGTDHPYDPADLRRCVELIEAHPVVGLVFADAMRGRSKEWAALVGIWEELTGLLKEEMSSGTGKAPRTYARMQEVLANA